MRLACGHPLINDGLLRVVEDDVPAAAPMLPAPRLVAYLSGDDTPAAGLTRRNIAPEQRRSHLFDAAQLHALRQLTDVLTSGQRVLVVIEGPRKTGRKTALALAATRPLLCLDLDRAGTRSAGLAASLQTLRRELALVDAVPVLTDLGIDRNAGDAAGALAAFVNSVPGPVAVTTALATNDLGIDRPVVRVRWAVPTAEVRLRLWQRALDGVAAMTPEEIGNVASRYRLGPGAIAASVASARAARASGSTSALTATEVITALRHNIAEDVAGLATRVEVTQSWDDLVLADDTLDQIRALVARLRHAHQVLDEWGYRGKLARGAGVAALFSGPPGTGKTMVAGLIARELDLELYQVDLSQVISKWVGETEKQLARVFDAAEAGHALLLFDEADALFGQRSTETRGAVDRYANLEVNFLLQRIEAFGGITVLTTNLDAAIDKALKRRLAGHVVFASPDEDERSALWRRLTGTATAPLADDLDFDELARVFPNMTGANIRNAAIAAAFHAASDGASSIAMAHLVRAGRGEYRSMGHMLAERPLRTR